MGNAGKIKSIMKRGLRPKFIKESAAIVFLLILAFLLAMRSPLNCFSQGISSTDSSVFRYVAFVMSKGGMPYKDAFDHKGPLLYLINYIGLAISFNHGIWYIEIVFMMSFLVASYKIARLFCGCGISCFITAVATAPLEYYYEGGNLTEEYAMVFLAIALYVFITYFLNDKINLFRLIICGVCFGSVVMLRANMVSIWVVFCIAVLVRYFRENKKIPWNFLLWFVMGSAIVIVPILIWLIHGAAFSYFVKDYIIFNMKYISYEGRANIYNKCYSIMNFLDCRLLLTSIVILVYFIKKKVDVFFNITYLACVLVSLYLMSISGMSYGHYGMVLIPLFVYPLSKMFAMMCKGNNGDGVTVVYSMLLLFLVFANWKGTVNTFGNALYTWQAPIPLSEGERVMLWIIAENTNEDETILVIGNKDFYYLESNRLAASRFSYQLPIAEVDEEIREKFTASLVDEKPKIVIVQDYTSNQYMDLFVTVDEYELLYEADEKIGIYRVKDAS